jgi:hypothetical protein
LRVGSLRARSSLRESRFAATQNERGRVGGATPVATIRKLKQVYRATHPGAHLSRRERPEREVAEPTPDIPPLAASSGEALETLDAMLDAEARSEGLELDEEELS